MSTILEELAEQLETVRQGEDWSYQDLTENMEEVTGKKRNEDCWRRFCLGKTPRPRRTTVTIVKEFLKGYETRRRKKRAS